MSARTTKECEPSGLLARFMNCTWDGTSSMCLGPTQKVLQDPVHMQRPAADSAKPTTFVKGKSSGAGKEEGGGLSRHLSKDCQVPACKTKSSAFARMMGTTGAKGKGRGMPRAHDNQFTAESFAKSNQCPAGREDLEVTHGYSCTQLQRTIQITYQWRIAIEQNNL